MGDLGDLETPGEALGAIAAQQNVSKTREVKQEKVLKSLEQTKRNVHSLYSQLAHNFYDKAKMTLQRGSYDDQLEILKRNLQSIKVKEEDKGKVENALKELEKIYEENEKINSILAKRN